MSEHDTTDPKPMPWNERVAHVQESADALVRKLTSSLVGPMADIAERMYREGVIAGLRVTEEQGPEVMPNGALRPAGMYGEATLRLRGAPADLAAVKPGWCWCDPNHGSVCSPRRRPASCDQRIIDDWMTDLDADGDDIPC